MTIWQRIMIHAITAGSQKNGSDTGIMKNPDTSWINAMRTGWNSTRIERINSAAVAAGAHSIQDIMQSEFTMGEKKWTRFAQPVQKS